jgi:hypothetical protein
VTIQGVRARLFRLEELSGELAKECAVIREAQDPLLYLERRKYLCAIADAIAGVEAVRVVLAKALQRMADTPEAESNDAA